MALLLVDKQRSRLIDGQVQVVFLDQGSNCKLIAGVAAGSDLLSVGPNLTPLPIGPHEFVEQLVKERRQSVQRPEGWRDQQRQKRAEQQPNSHHDIPLPDVHFFVFDQTDIIFVLRQYFYERALGCSAESIG